MTNLISQFDRVVFHSDGNNNDPDDIAALPVAAMLINGANAQAKTTFFYNNNLSEKNDSSQVEKMRNSAEYVEKLGINTVDYQANIDAATDRLVDIFNSGDEVLSIEGGPMEAVYRALEQTSPENLDNITLLSHSWWNENQDVITKDGVTEARTWGDLKAEFPQVTFLEIPDQNEGFYDDDWNWLDSKTEPVYQEARELMIDSNKRNDPSDAGMIQYALTGNREPDPYDAKSFLEDNPPRFVDDTTSPTQTETNTGNYDIEVDVDLTVQGDSFTGDISFTNDSDSSFEGWTIEVGTPFAIDNTQNAELASNPNNRYTFSDVSSNDYVESGEETTFTFEGDTQGEQFAPTNWTFNGESIDSWDVDIEDIGTNFTTPTDASPYYVEAEDMNLSGGYRIESNSFASNGKVISLYSGDGNNNDTGTATHTFDGESGVYDIIIDSFDENDGVGNIDVRQNGNWLDSFTLDRELGSNVADANTAISLEITDVYISTGDIITLDGIEQGNEWTGEHTRMDGLMFNPQQ